MRRVVITGLGITSCLGNDADTVSAALREGRSGIRHIPQYAELGFRSQVGGAPEIDLDAQIDRKQKRFMGDAAAFAHIALRDAIADAGLDEALVSQPRTGLIAGSGGGSAEWQIEAADLLRARGIRKVGPYMVPRTMCSTVSATLATAFKIKGVSYSISAACATSAHCIGAAADMIRAGRQDIMFAGGGGMLVLEDWDHAVARGARIHAELLGYGVTSDGADMVAPSGEGAVRCMRMALEGVTQPLDYLNTHGTSTPLGDIIELEAIRTALGDTLPPISSTKALSGHSLGAASVHEAIYCLLMMRDGFIAGSANIETLDEGAAGFPIVQASRDATLDTVMSNSFGFGGTNASLVFGRV